MEEFSKVARGFIVRSSLHEDGDKAQMVMRRINGPEGEGAADLIANSITDKICTTMAVWHRFNFWLIGHEIPLSTL